MNLPCKHLKIFFIHLTSTARALLRNSLIDRELQATGGPSFATRQTFFSEKLRQEKTALAA